MYTSLDCIPCFMKMALREARLASPDDERLQHEIVIAWGRMLGDLDFTEPPPAVARHLNALVRTMSGCGDLYAEDKRRSNAEALALLPGLRQRIETSRQRGEDPLKLALEIAIIGNFIDRGVDIEVDLEAELADAGNALEGDVYKRFANRADKGAAVVVLGDNCGEIAFDALLVEELIRRGCRVTYAVRSQPVINDATMADARAVGMNDLCEVVESGVDTPGTVLNRCTPEFRKTLDEADLILSKGQGNFESLEGVYPGVFCAFKVKCERVARDAELPLIASAFRLTCGPAAADKEGVSC